MRGNKYNAKKQACAQGHVHDSRKEARRCDELHLLQRAGEITALVIQPKYYFHLNGVPILHLNGRRVGYTPDFRYIDKGGQYVAEDAKGMRTEAYVLRAAIFRALYPDTVLREV